MKGQKIKDMPKDSLDKEYYVDNSREYFEFLIEARQWTGFDLKSLNRWIKNFESIDDGTYIACKILNRLIGYSEEDLVRMVKEGIMRILQKEVVLKYVLEKDFSVMESELSYEVNKALSRTLFAPLLSQNAPGESGDAIMRLITQRIKPQVQKMFVSELPNSYPCDYLILVDDCIGSGEQFSDFWDTAQVKNNKLLREWCKENHIKPFYLCLVAYKNSLDELQRTYDDIDIIAIETVSDMHEIFDLNNDLWDDELELEKAKEKIGEVIEEKGIPLLGYNDLHFGVVIHNNIPDWSLPILYKKRNGWNLLVERKNSYD